MFDSIFNIVIELNFMYCIEFGVVVEDGGICIVFCVDDVIVWNMVDVW